MKYFWLIIRHKWFVFVAGLKVGVPVWRLIKHDWTKFLPAELPHYQRQFFGEKNNPQGFIRAWIHHQNHNDHHWEYWIPRTGHNRCTPPYKDNIPVKMSWDSVKEMIADWIGASRAYEGKWPKRMEWEWMNKNLYNILEKVDPETKKDIESILIEQGF